VNQEGPSDLNTSTSCCGLTWKENRITRARVAVGDEIMRRLTDCCDWCAQRYHNKKRGINLLAYVLSLRNSLWAYQAGNSHGEQTTETSTVSTVSEECCVTKCRSVCTCLNLTLLTWTMWRAPTNPSEWRMGFNSAFKGLITLCRATGQREIEIEIDIRSSRRVDERKNTWEKREKISGGKKRHHCVRWFSGFTRSSFWR
jgi:hypothetical protein